VVYYIYNQERWSGKRKQNGVENDAYIELLGPDRKLHRVQTPLEFLDVLDLALNVILLLCPMLSIQSCMINHHHVLL
jgi:hypothetical protein